MSYKLNSLHLRKVLCIYVASKLAIMIKGNKGVLYIGKLTGYSMYSMLKNCKEVGTVKGSSDSKMVFGHKVD